MEHPIILQGTTPEKLVDLITENIKSQLDALKKDIGNQQAHDELLTRDQTCQFLQINSSTLWHWTNSKKVTAYGIANRRYYKRSELMDCLTQLKNKAMRKENTQSRVYKKGLSNANNQLNSPNIFQHKSQGKDKYFEDQMKWVSAMFKSQPSNMSMASIETGVLKPNNCRYFIEVQKQGVVTKESKISYFKNCRAKTPEVVNIEAALFRIKTGSSEALIKEIRKATDQRQKDHLKKNLPAVTFGGLFKDRSSLIAASGLACLDFDNVVNLRELKERLMASQYIYSYWVSPSGNGIKALTKIPIVESKEAYKQYYKAILSHFKEMQPDKATKDINRLCFESFDPDLYVNDDRVPKENFYRRLKQALNLEFLYPLTQKFYGESGQKSIDPVVFFKICLVYPLIRTQGGIIINRIDIDKRPKDVEKRETFGDLEGDTIIGKDHKGAIVTINDMLKMKKVNTREAAEVEQAIIELLEDWSPFNIRTMTVDNGKEFANHQSITQKTGVDIYFAKPYHSWQRGSNENLNGLIRQYIPKKTDFSLISDEYICYVENKINNRPRKRYGYHSPLEKMEKLLFN